MFGWFKKKSYEVQAVIEQNKMPDGNISEPVVSIVKSFSDKGRWKISGDNHPMDTNYYKTGNSFTATDTKTGEVYKIGSRGLLCSYTNYLKYMSFPSGVNTYSLPTWMTHTEKEYVVQAIDIISEVVSERFKKIKDRQRSKDSKQAKINQEKERQRLMDIYCNKESQM